MTEETNKKVEALDVRVDSLTESGLNPRRTFSDELLSELAASIEADGILQSLLVRPMRMINGRVMQGSYEVLCGARRLRAANLASLTHVPIRVRFDLDDDADALEAMIVENNQREDVHPLEEADGFAALRDEHGRSVEAIAAGVRRPVGYVHQRLVLTQLGDVARKLLAEEEITIGVAKVLARIPNPKVQAEAAKDFAARDVTVRWARAEVRRRYMLLIADATWSPDDAELLPAAGACTSCSKRTGAQAYLFDEVAGDDFCIDTGCWAAKAAANWERRSAEAAAKGGLVLTGAHAKKVWRYGGRPEGYLDLDDTPDYYTSSKKLRTILGRRKVPITLAQHPTSGDVVELVRAVDVKRALRAEPRKSDPASLSGVKPALSAADRKHREEMKVEKLKREARRAGHAASLTELIDKLCSDEPVLVDALELVNEIALWRFVAEAAVEGSYELAGAATRRDLEHAEGKAHVAVLEWVREEEDPMQLAALTLELALSDGYGNAIGGKGEPRLGERVLDFFGIDWRAHEASALAVRGAKKKAATKKAATKKKKAATKKKATEMAQP